MTNKIETVATNTKESGQALPLAVQMHLKMHNIKTQHARMFTNKP